MSWFKDMNEELQRESKATSNYILLGDRTIVVIDLKVFPSRRDINLAEGIRTYYDYTAASPGQFGTVLSATKYLHSVMLRELSTITDEHAGSATVEIRKKKNDKGRTEWEVFLKETG